MCPLLKPSCLVPGGTVRRVFKKKKIHSKIVNLQVYLPFGFHFCIFPCGKCVPLIDELMLFNDRLAAKFVCQ